uniref:NADH-ubiquinone oxidoreductase chain 2 n=1 Tax=Mecysmoderes ater TaxID=3158840 RepID=A0AAU7GJT7_9CUCU
MWQLYTILFYFTMILGSLVAITSSSWMFIWMGLEINLLTFMPIMKFKNNKQSSEATIKYFLIQAIASMIFLFGSIYSSLFFSYNNYLIEMSSSFMICMALVLKIGMAPFHFWLPEVCSGSSWKINFIILTWQKLAPMIIMFNSLSNLTLFTVIIMTSSLVSSLQGLNQTCLRKILAYSSISHSSWMITAMLNSVSLWFTYFFIYSMINSILIYTMNKYNINNIKQMQKMMSFNKTMKFTFMLNFMNLGGLPPFLGFFPKWVTVIDMTNNKMYFLAIILIIFTLITLYFYIRISMSSFSMNSEESIIQMLKKSNYFNMTTNSLVIFSLISCSFYTNFL